VRVKLVQGKAINIEGNPLYPINRGGICPKGITGLQGLYDPDRIKGPMKQVGGRGSGRWQRLSWEDAIGEVAAKLRALRERGDAHTVAILGGQYRGLMHQLLARFAQAYGTPNYLRNTACEEGSAIPNELTQGIHDLFGYDLERTRYVLSFGTSLLEAWWSPVRTALAYAQLRQGGGGARAKIIQVDPRFSMTAAKADEWVPINPGTDAALALGMAQVMLKEGLYDREFLAAHAFGFEDWTDGAGMAHLGFKTVVLRDYGLDRVSQITGVPMKSIIRLAREFSGVKPAVAVAERGASMHSNGIYTRMAIHALNALVGSIDVPGGVVFPHKVPLKALPPLALDEHARQGLAMPRLDGVAPLTSPTSAPRQPGEVPALYPLASTLLQRLPEAIAQQQPYPLNALFLYMTNPLFSSPHPARWAQALQKIPFVVSFSPHMDESSTRADLILPDHTYLERWQDDPMLPIASYTVFGLRQPAVKPLYDTLHTGDAVIRLAQALGGSVAQAFPWQDFVAVLRYSVQGIYEAQTGDVVEAFTHESWTALLARRGVRAPSYRSFEELWARLLDKGGWWDPAYRFGEWGRVFRTPSGRFELFSQTLKAILEDAAMSRVKARGEAPEAALEAVLQALQLEARGDTVYLPHYEPPRFEGDADVYPFHLNTYKLMTGAMGRGANQPHLQEIFGLHVGVKWDAWVEINPQTARSLGIADGDWVWVESPVGRVKTRARLFPGAMPHVVNIPFGQGHTAYGRWASGRGVNPNEVTAAGAELLGGLPTWFGTRVRVYKEVQG
jgi:anaerobic selenocysteine-containing dehydrogenase